MNKKCQVFTPKNYVKELLDSVDYKSNLYGNRILENSCGDGNILVEIVRRYVDDSIEKGLSISQIREGLARDVYGIEIDIEKYFKCIEKLNNTIKRYGIESVNWKIFNCDYLRWDKDIRFQFIVGNPPYITYKELDKKERKYVKQKFLTCNKGKFDYCYAFIEKSISSLAQNGKMAYLIPSSIFKNVHGINIRKYMEPYLISIKDYSAIKVFNTAMVKSSIIVLNKQLEQRTLDYMDMYSGNSIDITVGTLTDKWIFVREVITGTRRFGDYFKVSHAVATLCNKAYVLKDGEYEEKELGFSYNGYNIEKDMIRETASPKSLRYNKKEKIIFPYRYDSTGLVRLKEDDFVHKYPGTAAYLSTFRECFDNSNSDTGAKWYEYGRSQALSWLNNEKLLLSTVVTGMVSVYRLSKECIPYAGMYVVNREDNHKYTLQDAVGILTGEHFKKYVLGIGVHINGKSIRITSRDIENYTF